jgi:uncharacterized protein (DUF302 family)
MLGTTLLAAAALHYHIALVGLDTTGTYRFEGRIDGATPAHMSVALRFERADAVRVHEIVRGDRESYEADLAGTLDPATGRSHLVGTITTGSKRGMAIESNGHVVTNGPHRTISECEGIITEGTVQRFSVTSRRPFADVVSALDADIGHPSPAVLRQIGDVPTYAEVERITRSVVGPTDLMEFLRLDIGEVLRKANGQSAPKSLRLIVGNPLIMKQMVEHVPDAASYAPVTILVDERADGVHLSYDTMADFLAPYGNADALRVARDLDTKVETLLRKAAGSPSA